MTTGKGPRFGQVVVSGDGTAGNPFVFQDEDDRPLSSEEKRALRQARRDEAAADAVDRLTHHRRDEDR
jgi:hypothetical protein